MKADMSKKANPVMPPEIEAEIDRVWGLASTADKEKCRRIARMAVEDVLAVCELELHKVGGGAVGFAMDRIRTRYELDKESTDGEDITT